MKIFIICPVRKSEIANELEQYAQQLESEGHAVHLPHRDTNQTASGLEICKQNKSAIESADEVHIFYNPDSQGIHFDMGVAFALGKRICVVKNVTLEPGKSFARMLVEWECEL